MTRAEARRRAVEAAARALSATVGCDEPKCAACEQAGVDAIAAYERAMADAGWRMVRVVEPEIERDLPGPFSARDVLALQVGRLIGHNACRAAMLEDEP